MASAHNVGSTTSTTSSRPARPRAHRDVPAQSWSAHAQPCIHTAPLRQRARHGNAWHLARALAAALARDDTSSPHAAVRGPEGHSEQPRNQRRVSSAKQTAVLSSGFMKSVNQASGRRQGYAGLEESIANAKTIEQLEWLVSEHGADMHADDIALSLQRLYDLMNDSSDSTTNDSIDSTSKNTVISNGVERLESSTTQGADARDASRGVAVGSQQAQSGGVQVTKEGGAVADTQPQQQQQQQQQQPSQPLQSLQGRDARSIAAAAAVGVSRGSPPPPAPLSPAARLAVRLCAHLAAACDARRRRATPRGAVHVWHASLALLAAGRAMRQISNSTHYNEWARVRQSSTWQQLEGSISVILQSSRVGLLVASQSDLARIATGIGYLELRLPGDWLQQYLKVCQARMPDMNVQQLSLVAWAAAKTLPHAAPGAPVAPDAYWVQSLSAASEGHLAQLSPVSLTNMLWALNQWGHDPGSEWRTAATRALCAAVPAMRPDSLSAALAAAGILQPTTTHTAALLAASAEQVLRLRNDMLPQHDCEVLRAWVKASYLPAEATLQYFLSAVKPRLPRYTATQLASIAHWLAKLGFVPSADWLAGWAAALQGQLRAAGSSHAAMVLSACAIWRVLPPRELLVGLFDVSMAQARAGTMELASAVRQLVALADLMLPPSRQFLALLLQLIVTHPDCQPTAAARAGRAAPDAETAALLAAVVTCLPRLLGLFSREELLQTQNTVAVVVADDVPAAAAGAAGSGADADSDAAASLRTPPAWPGPPPPAAAAATAAAAAAEAAVAGPGAKAYTIDRHRSADVVDVLLPAGVAVPLLEALRVRLHLLRPRELYLIVRTLALMRLSPGPVFLSSHVAALAPHLAAMRVSHKAHINVCYKILTKDPTCLRHIS